MSQARSKAVIQEQCFFACVHLERRARDRAAVRPKWRPKWDTSAHVETRDTTSRSTRQRRNQMRRDDTARYVGIPGGLIEASDAGANADDDTVSITGGAVSTATRRTTGGSIATRATVEPCSARGASVVQHSWAGAMRPQSCAIA